MIVVNDITVCESIKPIETKTNKEIVVPEIEELDTMTNEDSMNKEIEETIITENTPTEGQIVNNMDSVDKEATEPSDNANPTQCSDVTNPSKSKTNKSSRSLRSKKIKTATQ